ncbi:S24 family peptidase [Sphingomonas sp. NBWT7]|uniref:S24 family peptidase n=1 Tax=Sphingomonas sp. NBWT7 TaxID=2596913 RepID=UPI00162A606C|nr:S24 family peptidase [Sphingomonas sp. NBWT7]QNE31911.1 S24 family peptidase [Sphingomonas sp. NBWT7]
MDRAVATVLEQLAAARGVSLSELSRLIGRNVAYLQQFVRRGTPRRLDERDRATLARFFGVAESVLGGAAPEQEVAVPYLSLAASAGRGAVAGPETVLRTVAFTARMLRDEGIDLGAASMIDAVGDSMLPTIRAGDRLLVDRSDRRVAATGIYVVRRDEDLLVKRVRADRSGLTLLSDNPDYPPIACAPDEATVIGRVKLLLRAP